jgi:ferredoxin--NADP+ reductase
MAAYITEKVLSVHHWNDTLFSFTTTRDRSIRFENGQFVMIGLEVDGRPLTRAYSIASPNYEETLEFFSIKVQDGPLTSRLQHLQPGDDLLVSRKPTGTLLLSDLFARQAPVPVFRREPAWAAFMSIIRDLDLYERFEKVVLVHGVRYVSELAYHDYIVKELPHHEFLGEFHSREADLLSDRDPASPIANQGSAHRSGRERQAVSRTSGLPPLDPAVDRAMICGSAAMLQGTVRAMLDNRGFPDVPTDW